MGYEVDFLAVGEESKSGDAIALRYGNLHGTRAEQTVVMVDGGFQASGEELVKHVRDYYGTSRADYVLCTHPDGDHSSGLSVVLEEMEVGCLLMHLPWDHAGDIEKWVADGRVTDKGIAERLQRSLEDARGLEAIAKRRGIPIQEPFSDGCVITPELTVLGPSTAYYEQLLLSFREVPAAAAASGVIGKMAVAVREAVSWVAESWGHETLEDPEDNATTAENNSSVITLLRVDGRQVLFVGDAGVPALTQAANFARGLGINLQATHLIQVPHHGSRHNVGPTILNHIVGPVVAENSLTRKAQVSVAKKGSPSRKVTNAFTRRGAEVFITQGKKIWHQLNAPPRANWGPVSPMPFYDQVEE